MRLIDADALRPLVLKAESYERIAASSTKALLYWAKAVRDDLYKLDNMPTIDAEPVTRCKDCALNGSWQKCPYFAWAGETPPDNWYCGKGKRRMTNDE